MKKILDNSSKEQSAGEWLRQQIAAGDALSIASAYFTIHGYRAIKTKLEKAKETRFLYGDPSSVGQVDPAPGKEKAFTLEDESLRLSDGQPLQKKWLATQCEEWVKRKSTQIRSIREGGFLHGKMYHTRNDTGKALCGSSNFTGRGLGETPAGGNLELNLACTETDSQALLDWFNDLWNDDTRVEDVKKRVLDALNRLGKDQTPQFIYYKTLYHIFEDRLREIKEEEEQIKNLNLSNTAIWQKLYEFQQHGARGVINRLLRHNGCIIADSVGLGKTFEALAVIKYFELQNKNVLVLCPKRLDENWKRYTLSASRANNPLEADRFCYQVLAHTDLGIKTGTRGNIQLDNFNWSAFDLIVIDESHNFRNIPAARRDEKGDLRASRYDFLLNEVIKKGVKSKVLMLSATPVNNRLSDLRNQIYLMTEGKQGDGNFRQSLDVPSIEMTLNTAQRVFSERLKKPHENRSKDDLLRKLDATFFSLLDGLTIARSRHHIKEHYPEFIKKQGGFPVRSAPDTYEPQTDLLGQLDYQDMAKRIEDFQLAVYHPWDYLKSDEQKRRKEEELEKKEFSQGTRERYLIGMMKVNFLKRLESSVESFRFTIERTIEKIDSLIGQIEEWQSKQGAKDGEVTTETQPDAEDMEDEYDDFVGSKRNYPLAEMELEIWLSDLRDERKVLADIKEIADRVNPDRDGKLQKLREVLTDKIKNPLTDRDGKENRKVLIFTTFADTAKYLYTQLQPWAQENGLVLAQIAGGGDCRVSEGGGDYNDILNRFAPHGREAGKIKGSEVDILIATDCLSEGQNLQDCDTVINYDIHWNPVRIVQRFGRIDRIGSRNNKVRMANFWPPMEMDKYLQLKNRVQARMEMIDLTATGQDNLLTDEEKADEEGGQMELHFRDEQVRRIKTEILDAEGMDDSPLMSDFTMDDFLSDLQAYMEKNDDLEKAPLGLFAVAEAERIADKAGGVFFCLRRKETDTETLPPVHLLHVNADNEVRRVAKPALTALRAIARDVPAVNENLARQFDKETQNGEDMSTITPLLKRAMDHLEEAEQRQESKRLESGGWLGDREKRKIKTADRYELVTWTPAR